MPVDRNVNLFEIVLTTAGANGQPGADIPIRDALDAIAALEYDPDAPHSPTNRYHFRTDQSVRYAFDFQPFGPRLIAGTMARVDLEGGEVESYGTRTRLELEEGQGIATPTHFLINPERREILLESTVGARQGDVARYLESRLDGNMAVPVEGCRLRQIVDQAALDKFLNRTGSVGRFEIVVERPHIPAFRTAKDNGTITDQVHLVEAVEAASAVSRSAEVIHVKLGREPHARTGGMRGVKATLASIGRALGPETRKLSGLVEDSPDDSGRLMPFDLLTSKTSRRIRGIATETRRKYIVPDDMFARMAEAYEEMERG